MNVAIYVPHGCIPDQRGFAPAIVAWEFGRHFRRIKPMFITGCEGDARPGPDLVQDRTVFRLQQSDWYKRLFTKMTRLDPLPLHARAAKVVNQTHPEIFHAHQLEFPVDDFRRRLKQRIPIVVHAHVSNRRFDPERGTADCYVAVSHYVKRRLVEQGYPETLIQVIPNGVDSQLFAPMPHDVRMAVRRQMGLPRDAYVLLFVGRKQEIKGFHTFLRVVEIILARHPQVVAVAVGGEPPDAADEPSYVWRQDLRENLRQTGRYFDLPPVRHARLQQYYAIANAALLPSLAETQGIAILEAMSCCCLVISSNNSGIVESVVDGESGWLLDHPEQIDPMVAAVERAIAEDHQLGAVRRAARDRAIRKFDWTVVTALQERLYFSLHNKGYRGYKGPKR